MLQVVHQKRNDTSAACNHALYLKPRAEMTQAWADYLQGLLHRPGRVRLRAERCSTRLTVFKDSTILEAWKQ